MQGEWKGPGKENQLFPGHLDVVCEGSFVVEGWAEQWVGEFEEGSGGVEIVGVGERRLEARQTRMSPCNSCLLSPHYRQAYIELGGGSRHLRKILETTRDACWRCR